MFRRQQPGLGDAATYPSFELALGVQPIGFHAQPTSHLPTAHLERAGVGPGQQPVGLAGIDAYHQAAMTASRHRNVPADKEG